MCVCMRVRYRCVLRCYAPPHSVNAFDVVKCTTNVCVQRASLSTTTERNKVHSSYGVPTLEERRERYRNCQTSAVSADVSVSPDDTRVQVVVLTENTER